MIENQIDSSRVDREGRGAENSFPREDLRKRDRLRRLNDELEELHSDWQWRKLYNLTGRWSLTFDVDARTIRSDWVALRARKDLLFRGRGPTEMVTSKLAIAHRATRPADGSLEAFQ